MIKILQKSFYTNFMIPVIRSGILKVSPEYEKTLRKRRAADNILKKTIE